MATPSKQFPRDTPVPEQSSYLYEVTLQTPEEEAVEPAQIEAIYLTLRDIRTGSVVNSRNAIQVKDANGGTLATGLFTFQFEPEDMPAIGTEELQPRKLTLDFRLYGGGRLTREVWFWVRAMDDIEAIP